MIFILFTCKPLSSSLLLSYFTHCAHWPSSVSYQSKMKTIVCMKNNENNDITPHARHSDRNNKSDFHLRNWLNFIEIVGTFKMTTCFGWKKTNDNQVSIL